MGSVLLQGEIQLSADQTLLEVVETETGP